MKYEGQKTSQISFPLGGIGSGSIGLSGTGRLIDWEIFNKPAKGSTNGNTHFAIRAEKDGKVIDFRLLQGDLPPPYLGVTAEGYSGNFKGMGFGPDYSLMCGWPHFRDCSFTGEFPFAALDFADPLFPGKAKLYAWSPFIPGESRDSSMPVASFDISVENTTSDTLTYSCIAVLANPWPDISRRNIIEGRTLICKSGLPDDDFAYGNIAISLIEGEGEFSYQTYWYRGGWCDSRETYYRDVMRGGNFTDRRYDEDSWCVDHGLLCIRFDLAPGEKRNTRFAIAWSIPNRKNTWNANADEDAKADGIINRWKNYYATQWEDSKAVLKEFAVRHDQLEAQTRRFHDALFSSTLPTSVLDGIAANLTTLRTPTCLRLEDGTFYGWEGVGQGWGSCEGSCTHVWNYQQSLPFLFPDLERSMREANFNYGIDEFGASHFRVPLPIGIKTTSQKNRAPRACADGQFGDVMKSYRDWKISGDTMWLGKWWPTIRRLVEFAWSPDNQDRWDPNESGVLTGRQHHTLDMELFGPSGWLNSHYLGALKAAAEMADAMGETDFAAKCRNIFRKGYEYTNSRLFSDGHFIHEIDLDDKAITDAFSASDIYWNAEAGEIKYQAAKGCGIDGALGQLYASLYGLGDVLDPAKVKTHLETVYERNFFRHARDIFNAWRNYTVNDEGGVMMCTWTDDDRPAIPLPYNTENMNGFEWAYASHLAYCGLTDKATEIADAIRDRYDGEKRNPYNEIECGSNYARSMAAYGMLPAWSGFSFDMTKGEIGFSPRKDGDFKCFWSLGTCWGTAEFIESDASLHIEILHGDNSIKRVKCDSRTKVVFINGEKLPDENIISV